MKRIIAIIFALLLSSLVQASQTTYDGNIVDTECITNDMNYDFNLKTNYVDLLSVQMVYGNPSLSAIYLTTANVNTTLDTITTTGTIVTGISVVYSSAAFSGGGLVNGATYYTIRYSATAMQLATSKANAIAGTAVNITTTSVAQGSMGFVGQFSLTPTVMLTAPADYYGLKWFASNDNENWYDLSKTSITTGNVATTSYIWDFSQVNFKYLRAQLKAATIGNLKLKLRGFGRRTAQ